MCQGMHISQLWLLQAVGMPKPSQPGVFVEAGRPVPLNMTWHHHLQLSHTQKHMFDKTPQLLDECVCWLGVQQHVQWCLADLRY
jgi:hypothetical protein